MVITKAFALLANAKTRTAIAKLFALHKTHKSYFKTALGYV